MAFIHRCRFLQILCQCSSTPFNISTCCKTDFQQEPQKDKQSVAKSMCKEVFSLQFAGKHVEVEWLDATLQLFQLPDSQLTSFFALLFSVSPLLPIGCLKAKSTCQSVFVRHDFGKIWKTFNSRHMPSISCTDLIFFWCYFDVAWSLQLEDGRIANERFRDVEVVPLERIFQTCTFCSSPCTGSTDNVLCNMKCNMISCSSFMSVRSMLHLFVEVSHTSTFRMTIA